MCIFFYSRKRRKALHTKRTPVYNPEISLSSLFHLSVRELRCVHLAIQLLTAARLGTGRTAGEICSSHKVEKQI